MPCYVPAGSGGGGVGAVRGCTFTGVLACRTGVIFCVFQANRGESEASAWRARVACEGRSAKKSRLSPYHCSSRSGVQI